MNLYIHGCHNTMNVFCFADLQVVSKLGIEDVSHLAILYMHMM